MGAAAGAASPEAPLPSPREAVPPTPPRSRAISRPEGLGASWGASGFAASDPRASASEPSLRRASRFASRRRWSRTVTRGSGEALAESFARAAARPSSGESAALALEAVLRWAPARERAAAEACSASSPSPLRLALSAWPRLAPAGAFSASASAREAAPGAPAAGRLPSAALAAGLPAFAASWGGTA